MTDFEHPTWKCVLFRTVDGSYFRDDPSRRDTRGLTRVDVHTPEEWFELDLRDEVAISAYALSGPGLLNTVRVATAHIVWWQQSDALPPFGPTS